MIKCYPIDDPTRLYAPILADDATPYTSVLWVDVSQTVQWATPKAKPCLRPVAPTLLGNERIYYRHSATLQTMINLAQALPTALRMRGNGQPFIDHNQHIKGRSTCVT